MITKNAMQLKALMKSKAKKTRITAQAALQIYCLERFLYRLSKSPEAENFIIKGGFLISSLIGIENRSTMDIDTTVKGFDLNKGNLESILRNVCNTHVETDQFLFTFDRLEDIREADDYPGLRAFITAEYDGLSVPMTVDVTTGDSIIPSEVKYEYKCVFDDELINIKAYPLENILAEKLETIVSRGIANTRPRDFYDIHLLYNLKKNEINYDVLQTALNSTCCKRGTLSSIEEYKARLTAIISDKTQLAYWKKYSSRFSYAHEISFSDAVKSAEAILDRIMGKIKEQSHAGGNRAPATQAFKTSRH